MAKLRLQNTLLKISPHHGHLKSTTTKLLMTNFDILARLLSTTYLQNY